MAEFTKGKWIACDDCTVAVLRDDIHIHCFVAECSSDYLYIDDDDAKANTRLIAAAPEMYNFIRTLYELLNIPAARRILEYIDGKKGDKA